MLIIGIEYLISKKYLAINNVWKFNIFHNSQVIEKLFSALLVERTLKPQIEFYREYFSVKSRFCYIK